jgi:hypothetical protein
MNERELAPGSVPGFVPPLPLTRPAATGPRPVHRQVPRRHRTGQVHAVVASTLAILALVGCVIAVLMLATEPTAAKLESEVGSLNSRLHAAQGQLARLHGIAAQATASEAGLQHAASGLRRKLTGLQRTVHGLQNGANLMQDEAAALRDCAPQLQQELAGLTLKSRSVHGRLTNVGLSDSIAPSSACQAVFSERDSLGG